ncbi:peptidoglycan editing factor PgeF [Polynucleobacter sp. AP-Nino-20-G2]|uniref:peptidoglycan editing factor PgeF n=1 Tax=Polynucleobacter sp. AP-Nino-20-G2 TaxID=2576917 RepID=UPI00203EACF9|nr:peptidoglycan editing factor PgeF [Polynucleobacter sp. AP-Nino-20-G2]
MTKSLALHQSPDWLLPAGVKAAFTTRVGGVSKPPFDSFNLGLNAGDDLNDVLRNREILRGVLPAEPQWLKQVHGTQVSTPASRALQGAQPYEADASVSNYPNDVLVVLTADCLPVLFSSRAGDVVGAAHAGWRGLSAGVLENTVQEMRALSPGLLPQDILVWMGPAIGPQAFEVGQDVVDVFLGQSHSDLTAAFIPIPASPGKYLANLYLLAQDRLRSLGINSIQGGGLCTVVDRAHFFSYRRDQVTGRFASLIWISSEK